MLEVPEVLQVLEMPEHGCVDSCQECTEGEAEYQPARARGSVSSRGPIGSSSPVRAQKRGGVPPKRDAPGITPLQNRVDAYFNMSIFLAVTNDPAVIR